MRALTIVQPWATLIAIGEKRIETRSWGTSYRGPVLIHAGASKKYVHLGWRVNVEPLVSAVYTHPMDLPLGVIVAIADIVDCVEITIHNIEMLSPNERRFGHYAPGRYAWHLANVRPLDKPVPAKGQRGLWVPDRQLLEALQACV